MPDLGGVERVSSYEDDGEVCAGASAVSKCQ